MSATNFIAFLEASIHPSTLLTSYSIQGGAGGWGLEAITVVTGREEGCTLDRWLLYHRASQRHFTQKKARARQECFQFSSPFTFQPSIMVMNLG